MQKNIIRSSGTLHHLRFPSVDNKGGNNIRVECGVYEGGQVSTHYDAMIAKLICHVDGINKRQDALKLMSDSLERFEISGLQTNIEFLKRVLKHNAFTRGGVCTDFIPTYKDDLFDHENIDNISLQKATASASLAYLLYYNPTKQIKDTSLIGYTTNGNITGSNGGEYIQLLDIKDNDIRYNTFIARCENDKFVIRIGDKQWNINHANLSIDNKFLSIQLSDEYIECHISFYDNKLTIFYNGTRYDYIHTPSIELLYPPEFTKGKGGIIIADLLDHDAPVIHHKSPMQAQVAELKVKIGQNVQKNQLLANVISMKQYYEIWAQCDGIVTDIIVDVADSVSEGQTLIKVERNSQQSAKLK